MNDPERTAPAPASPLQSFDARVWARSFMEHNAINPEIARDEETMVTWFANALMRGYDERANAKPEQPPVTAQGLRGYIVNGKRPLALCNPSGVKSNEHRVLMASNHITVFETRLAAETAIDVTRQYAEQHGMTRWEVDRMVVLPIHVERQQ